jgi:hemolysin III
MPSVGHTSGVDIELKPRLRGVFHQYAFYVAMIAGAVLVAVSDSARELVATWIYAVALAAMFGVSALYHRVNWRSTRVRTWMRRLDHSTILLLIAGTYTPFALLAFDGRVGDVILVVVWCGAAAGLVLNLAWVDAPKWLTALVFIALGWVGVVAVPELLDLGVAPLVLVVVGGGLYTLGAVTYALRRPNPAPGTFGYHEIFHVLVIAAAAVHFIAIAAFVAPGA